MLRTMKEQAADNLNADAVSERLARQERRAGGSVSARLISLPARPTPQAQTLPKPLTPLLGREEEVAAVTALVRAGERLITLHGPGGVGKTRFSIEIAAALGDSYPDSAVWIPLASVARASLVESAIAQALGVRESGDRSLMDGLVASLRSAQMLLVLDNFEHVLDAAPVVSALLASCPNLIALVTSRTILRVSGERPFPISPLAVFETSKDSSVQPISAAIQLFRDRSQSVSPGFEVTATNLTDIAEICRRLDGLPLAIELAAARSNLMPPATLRVRLDRRLPLLTSGARDLPERQRTMRSAIGWSYDLLSEPEQRVFRRLGVFAGGATIDAALDVCSAAGDLDDPIAALSGLIDGSLVRLVDDGPSGSRLHVLELVREYAAELLAADPAGTATREAHACHYRDLAKHHNILEALQDQAVSLEIMEREHANIRVALQWFRDGGDHTAADYCQLCEDAFAFWWARGHIQEGLEWLEHSVNLLVPSVLRASVLRCASYLRIAQGDLDTSESLAREAITTAKQIDNDWIQAYSYLTLAWSFESRGVADGVLDLYFRGLELSRSSAPYFPFQEATLLESIAEFSLRGGKVEQAEAHSRAALSILVPLRERYGIGFVYRTLGWSLYARGAIDEAISVWTEGLRASLDVDDRWQIADSIATFARVANDAGQFATAARWLAAAQATMTHAGRQELEHHDQFELSLQSVRTRLADNEFNDQWRDGSSVAINVIVDEIENSAWNFTKQAVADPAFSVDLPRLTSRERDILQLLAAGNTDREIAETLFLSVRTIEGHVARIFAKLGVHTRSAATRQAIETGLVSLENK